MLIHIIEKNRCGVSHHNNGVSRQKFGMHILPRFIHFGHTYLEFNLQQILLSNLGLGDTTVRTISRTKLCACFEYIGSLSHARSLSGGFRFEFGMARYAAWV